MDPNIVAVMLGIVSGAIGYWVSTFTIQPILRYRSIKNTVLIDFIYYAQVVNSCGLSDDLKALHRERVLANRKSSASLMGALLELPWWYSLGLRLRSRDPKRAAGQLIGYSNTTSWDDAVKIENSIRRNLGLPE